MSRLVDAYVQHADQEIHRDLHSQGMPRRWFADVVLVSSVKSICVLCILRVATFASEGPHSFVESMIGLRSGY